MLKIQSKQRNERLLLLLVISSLSLLLIYWWLTRAKIGFLVQGHPMSLGLDWILGMAVLLLSLACVLVIRSRALPSSPVDVGERSHTDRLSVQIQKRFDHKANQSLLYLNIRGFAQINFRYGNDFGDRLLAGFSALVEEILSGAGELYHLNADEFIFLFREKPFHESYELVRAHVDTLSEVNLNIDDDFVHFHVFCGLLRLQESEGQYPDVLYQVRDNFDEIMNLSQDNFFVYQELEHLNNIRVRKYKNKSLVEEAISENRIIPYFQPIVDVRTGEVSIYEVLMRIQENGKILSPYRYVRIAEEFNLIEEMDFAVFRKSVDCLALSDRDLRLSFNLSGKLLTNDRYLSRLLAYLEEKRVPAWRITFEITETEHVGDLNNLDEILNKYKRLGFTFAIDDFGTGFSSVHYLKHLPVDYVKIDGAFIRDLDGNESNVHLVRSLVYMARAFHIKTVAEYVENERILELVRELGIDYAQGYYLGLPREQW